MSEETSVGSQDDAGELTFLYCYDPTKFEPQVYRFKTRVKNGAKVDGAAVSPPFWVLMDHLIAVVWRLYNEPDPASLGIEQLEWALQVLRCMKGSDELELCNVTRVQAALEEALLHKYAYMTQAHVEITQDDDIYRESSGDSDETMADKEKKTEGGTPKSPVILTEILNRKNLVYKQKVMTTYPEDSDDTGGTYTFPAMDETTYATLTDWVTMPYCLEKTAKNERDERDEANRNAVNEARQDFLEHLKSLKDDHMARIAAEQAALDHLEEIMVKVKDGEVNLDNIDDKILNLENQPD